MNQKTQISVDGKSVTLTLTPEQIIEISRQTNPIKHGTDIKSWEDICTWHNIDPVKSIEWVKHLDPEDQKPQLAIFRIVKMVKAVNNGKDPYSERRGNKSWPYAKMYDDNDKAGFGFSRVVDVWTYSESSVGSRLTYLTDELAEHGFKTFEAWYEDWMVTQPE